MVISPCSSNRARNFRNWSVENYAAAANHAYKKHGCQIVVTGGGSTLEHEYGRSISELCGAEVVDLVGKTSLKELLAVIDAGDFLVAPDSGPVHMATTVGTPVIGLYRDFQPGPHGALSSSRPDGRTAIRTLRVSSLASRLISCAGDSAFAIRAPWT